MAEQKGDEYAEMSEGIFFITLPYFPPIYLSTEGDEVLLSGTGGTEAENEFDMITGFLEEILMNPEFGAAQEEFCIQNCSMCPRL